MSPRRQSAKTVSLDERDILSRATSMPHFQSNKENIASAQASRMLHHINTVCSKQLKVGIHTSIKQNGLMEFFDDEKNWGENRIKVGRSWKKDELRLKSNEDLHKLWYILLKEKNMLLTMEHECKHKFEYFPNPERIDKVEESMENLETVVRERNKAYYKLETGEHGERPTRIVRNQIGLPFRYKMTEHIIPKFMNEKWRQNNIHYYGGYAVQKFLRLYREKLFIRRRRHRNYNQMQVQLLLRRFPNMDIEALKSKYPDVDLEKVKKYHRSQGHYVPQ
ncbi:hypothetical protein PV325_005625 [Microctonus aethiopoides]|nr:hypothetical protein PV325_005625 [Microctonus aethiopoides]